MVITHAVLISVLAYFSAQICTSPSLHAVAAQLPNQISKARSGHSFIVGPPCIHCNRGNSRAIQHYLFISKKRPVLHLDINACRLAGREESREIREKASPSGLRWRWCIVAADCPAIMKLPTSHQGGQSSTSWWPGPEESIVDSPVLSFSRPKKQNLP